MKIRTQFLTTMLLFGLVLIITAVLLVDSYRRIDRLNEREDTTGKIERAAWELSYLSNDYLLNHEKQQETRWLAKSTELSVYLTALQVDMPEQQLLKERIKENHVRLRNIFTDVAAAITGETEKQDSAGQLSFTRLAWSRLEVQNQDLVFDVSRLSKSLAAEEDNLRQRNNLLLFALIGIFGAYLIINYFMIYRRTLRSMTRLQTGARIIGSGRLDYTIDDRGKDEMGELSMAFNQMTRSLREITASKADLEREITERQQAEEELLASEAELRQSEAALRASEAQLRKSEARLRRLVDANIIGVVTRDVEGRIEDANDAFLEMVGYTRADLESGGLNIFDLVPPEDHKLEMQWMETSGSAEASGPREKAYLRKDGHRVPVLAGETEIEGDTPLFIGFVLDLTALKQAQAALAEYAEKLKHSNQELEQFAFIASHDLQEPLRKIRSFGDTLSRRLGDKLEPEPREYLQRMQSAAERMQDMINDLLELSRIGRRGEKFTSVCLSEVANEVVSDLEPRIQAARGQVQVDLEDGKIEADPLQMRQLLQNLISNAIKYHQPGVPPVVRVWSRMEKDGPGSHPTLTIAVEDNGIGFSEEYLERIFQPFTRLHGRSEYEGTGMGLAICKKIVERHQGTITARSQLGQGSTFFVSIPAGRNR